MRLRPCIDIHNGRVKQIVGSTLRDEGDSADENYTAPYDAAYFAARFRDDGLTGGHVIMLNAKDSPYYPETKAQALLALRTFPGGLMAGGGITPANAAEFLDAGASHVIVTSYIFQNGKFSYDRLQNMVAAVGRERLVLDLSCKKVSGGYHIVTDRWQNVSSAQVTPFLLDMLSGCCAEFLIHGVDAEGKSAGVDKDLVQLLTCSQRIPITYAGGIGSFSDRDKLYRYTEGKLDVTIGSALDLYGGPLPYAQLLRFFPG